MRNTISASICQLKPEDIRFFDNLFVCKGFVGIRDNKIVFRDIYLWVEHLKYTAAINDEPKTIEILPLCFRGGARAWHTKEVSELHRSLLRFADLRSWIKTLIQRFSKGPSIAMNAPRRTNSARKNQQLIPRSRSHRGIENSRYLAYYKCSYAQKSIDASKSTPPRRRRRGKQGRRHHL
jgi:hypothetical protein